MKHPGNHWSIVILLCCWTAALAAPSFGSTDICGEVSNLKSVHKHATQNQGISDPPGTRLAVNRLLARFATLNSQVANPAVELANRNLLRLSADLDRMTAPASQPSDIIDPSAYLHLSQLLTSLTQIETIFGCNTPKAVTKTDPSDGLHSSVGGQMSLVSSLAGLAMRYALLPFLVLSTILAAALIFKSTRREERKICRTSLLIVYGKQCTVSHIVDIGRKGMKIEAAKKEVANQVVDLYFCGHHVQGKIAWKNKFYVGIRFKTKISQQMLDDVIGKSHKALAESSLSQKATPCFHYGCHINCAHHLPTAISEKQPSG